MRIQSVTEKAFFFKIFFLLFLNVFIFKLIYRFVFFLIMSPSLVTGPKNLLDLPLLHTRIKNTKHSRYWRPPHPCNDTKGKPRVNPAVRWNNKSPDVRDASRDFIITSVVLPIYPLDRTTYTDCWWNNSICRRYGLCKESVLRDNAIY